MIDYISFFVNNFKENQDFYEQLMNFDTEEHQVMGKMASYPFELVIALFQVKMRKLAKQKGFMWSFWHLMLHLFINGMKILGTKRNG